MARGKKKETLTPEERLQAALVPESEQPYKVPGNWCWTRLGSLGYTNIGLTYKPSDKSETGTIVLRSSNIQDGKIDYSDIVRVNISIPENKMTHKGDILICARNGSKALVGKTALVDMDGMSYGAFMAIFRSPYNKIVFYYLNSPYFRDIIDRDVGTTTINQVTQNLIKELPFPLPPLSEQQRIVDRIESLFAKLDEAKQKAQDALDSFETRKAAILHKAFTGELTVRWRKEHGIGMGGWKTITFKDACLKITDGTHHSPVNTPTGEYMYVTAKNIKETGIDLTNITFVSKDVHDEIYSRCDVQYGDVLYIKDGATTGIATVNTIEEPFSLLSSVAVLRPDKKQIMAKYMVYNLNSSKTKAMMINNMSGNAITRLTLSKIKTAPITVCSLDEQAEIVRILDHLLSKEQQAKEAVEGVLEQINLIKKAILARAFRGELGTNAPNDESAVELLKVVV